MPITTARAKRLGISIIAGSGAPAIALPLMATLGLLSNPVFVVPLILGSVLNYLGARLKVDGDSISGYGLLLGMGCAIIVGCLVILSVLATGLA